MKSESWITRKCIIFIRGFDPIMDNKFIPFNHPMFNQTADGKGEPYVHQIRGAENLIGPPFEILSDKAVKYYEKLRDKGENVYIDSLTYEQFMMLGDAELSRRFSMQDERNRSKRLTGSRRMSLSMSMNRRSLMLQKVPTLLMEVLVLSL